MSVATELLVLADGAMHDGHRVRGLAGHDEGPPQADACGQDARVAGGELTGPIGQHSLVPLNRFRRVPGRQVRGGQLGGHRERVRMARGQLGVAARGEIRPEVNGGPDQAGFVQAAAHPQQQRMAPLGPQRIDGRVLQAGHVRPQAGRRPRLRLLGGPDFEQRVRGRPRRGLLELGGCRQLDRGLEGRAHQDGRRRDVPVDADQADSLEDEQHVPHLPRVGSGGERSGPPAQVRDQGLRAEDGSRNAVTVQKRQEDQHQPDGRARQQRFRPLQAEDPGHHGRRRDLVGAGPDLLPPLDEVVPVVPAGQVGARDRRGSLAERQWLAAERLDEVDGALALDRVRAEPFGQAVQRLPGAEQPDRDDPRPGAADGRGRGLVTSSRPAGPAGHSPLRSADSGTSSRTTSQGCLVSLSQLTKRTATESAVPVGSRPVAATDACTNPDRTAARSVAEIQISPSMTCDRHNDSAIITADLGLAARAGPVRQALGGGRVRHERNGRSRDEDVREAAGGVGSVGKPLGERRHLADPEAPRWLSWHSHWASPPATPHRGRPPANLLRICK